MSEDIASSVEPDGQVGSEHTLHWYYNPWRAKWQRPAAALSISVAVAAIAGYTFTTPDWWPQALGWGGLSLLLLLGMTAVLYVPVGYRLDQRGVSVRFLGVPQFRPWDYYRNFYVHETGVHLTTMPQPSPLDPFRGHFLQYGAKGTKVTRDEIVAFIEARMTLKGIPDGPASS